MTDPTSTPVAAAGASWLIAMVLAYFGIDYFALFAALAGVLVTLGNMKALGVLRMVGTVVVMTVAAAIMGQGLADIFHMNTRPAVMVFSLLFGGAGQVGIQAAIGAMLSRLKKLGGEQGGNP